METGSGTDNLGFSPDRRLSYLEAPTETYVMQKDPSRHGSKAEYYQVEKLEYKEEPSTGFFGAFERHRDALSELAKSNKKIFKWSLTGLFLAGYIAYLIYILWLNFARAQCILWGTLAIAALIVYFNFVKPLIIKQSGWLQKQSILFMGRYESSIKIALLLAYLIGLGVFLGIDTASDPSRLRALAGIVLFLLLGVLFSNSPGSINWRLVVSGTAVQFILGLIVLRWETGKNVFEWIGNFLQKVLSYANAGSAFVFSPGEKDHTMVFTVMPVLLFASFLVAILYHIGAMSWFVEKVGWLIYVCLGTTAAESISAAANVFLGQTEAPLTIKPYIPLLTVSELMAVMSGGFATISGSLMVTYATMGVDPKNLLAASVMNAPAALVLAKLLYPEKEKSQTDFKNLKRDKGSAYNVLDAAMSAAGASVQAIAGIIAMLICATAFIALVDGLLGFLGGLADYPKLTLAVISGWVFYPVAFVMGVDERDCQIVGQLLGYKTFVNEFVAYAELQKITKNVGQLSEKGIIVATYALCGFANFASVGIQLANFTIMAPNRKNDITRLVLRALFAGFAANMLTASIAGLLVTPSGYANPTNGSLNITSSTLLNITASTIASL